jgi:hypothetical protein
MSTRTTLFTAAIATVLAARAVEGVALARGSGRAVERDRSGATERGHGWHVGAQSL